jgi:hypothetical protein
MFGEAVQANVEEACKLLEVGFECVTEFERKSCSGGENKMTKAYTTLENNQQLFIKTIPCNS